MRREIAVWLGFAAMAFGQQSPALPGGAPQPLIVDAVAVDAAGRPVVDLTAGDFEVAQGGSERKITSVSWFDTRLHTAATRSGQFPALDLLPDDIRRNLVVVVDDLGLTPASIRALQKALETYVASGMARGDRMAILRSSGGTGARQQLTGETRKLTEAIEDIRYLGGSTTPSVAGRAAWLAVRYALDGLREFTGRKAVVLVAEHPEMVGPSERGTGEAARAAHAAGAAVYAIHPLAEPPAAAGGKPWAMETLARETGGHYGGDLAQVLTMEQGYYAICFPRADTSLDSTGRWTPASPPVVKVRRPGVSLRWRAGYVTHVPRGNFPAPTEYADLLRETMRSPFADAAIPTRLTAVFADYPPTGGPMVEVVLHFDPHAFTYVHDLEDIYHGAVQLRLYAYRDDGLSTLALERGYQLHQRQVDYRFGMEHGLNVTFQVRLPDPGAWQIRAIVADGASDRMGSATQFVEVPDVKHGVLALSGVVLYAGVPATEGPAHPDPQGEAGVRIFKPGQACTFLYSIFNALTGADKKTKLEVRTRVFAEGRALFEGKPGLVSYGAAASGTRQQITGQLKLDPEIGPGEYVLQVIARDLLAPAGEQRTATQFMDFAVR